MVAQAESKEKFTYLCRGAGDLRRKFFPEKKFAAIAQLVEHDLAKVGVASSSLVCRSILRITKQLVNMGLLFLFDNE